MSFYKNIGELVLGTRLKRLSDKFMMDVSRIYADLKIDFEISWFPIFYLLDLQGEISVTEAAKELEITHSAVSQLISTLNKRDLIKITDHSDDKRKKVISFTAKGKKLLQEVKPVWESLERTVKKTLSLGVNSSSLLNGLSELEESIRKESLGEKVLKDIKLSEEGTPEIIPYHEPYIEGYKALVLDWIVQAGNEDVKKAELLSNPKEIIDEHEGIVLLAKLKNEIIGAIIALPVKNNTSEIIFFVVSENWQKRNIGRELINNIKECLRTKGCMRVAIKVNSNLSNVIKLLKENGFILSSVENVTSKDGNGNTNICLEQNLGIG